MIYKDIMKRPENSEYVLNVLIMIHVIDEILYNGH